MPKRKVALSHRAWDQGAIASWSDHAGSKTQAENKEVLPYTKDNLGNHVELARSAYEMCECYYHPFFIWIRFWLTAA